MNIAIVDDMPRELSRISQILNEYGKEHNISIDINTFQSGEELLKVYRPLQYTLIFMDIYMDGMTGVDAARKIRETDKKTLIVFLTTSPEHTFDAFDVHAYGYIIKVPEDESLRSDIFRTLDDVILLCTPSEDVITVSADGEDRIIPFSSIVYAQAEKNYIKITDSNNETCRTRMTFSYMFSLLNNDSRFMQINRGLLINMDYIDTFGKDTCVLKGGYSLPINVREHKKLDQIRKNYIFSRLQNRHITGGSMK